MHCTTHLYVIPPPRWSDAYTRTSQNKSTRTCVLIYNLPTNLPTHPLLHTHILPPQTHAHTLSTYTPTHPHPPTYTHLHTPTLTPTSTPTPTPPPPPPTHTQRAQHGGGPAGGEGVALTAGTLPPSLLRRFEVYFKPRPKMERRFMRSVGSNQIGHTVKLKVCLKCMCMVYVCAYVCFLCVFCVCFMMHVRC